MNNIILKGRLTKSPETRNTESGKVVTSITVACDTGKDRPADFINCVAWEKTAELIDKYFDKGSEILLTGALKNRSYDDKDGIKRYVSEVRIDRVEFCGSKSKGESSNSSERKEKTSEKREKTPDELFGSELDGINITQEKDVELPF